MSIRIPAILPISHVKRSVTTAATFRLHEGQGFLAEVSVLLVCQDALCSMELARLPRKFTQLEFISYHGNSRHADTLQLRSKHVLFPGALNSTYCTAANDMTVN
jgi:hypothetical protein